MRRTKLVLAAAAVMVALLVAFAAPAMAKGNGHNNDNGNDRQLDRQDIRLDQQLLNNRFDHFNNFTRFDDNDFGVNNFNNSCFNFPFCNDFNDSNDSHGAVSGSTLIINRG